ncbi:6767_t:CDS:2, partial [Gigaspora rosea]
TVTEQLVIDKQKFGHSNPYEVLTHDMVTQNENENYIEIEGNKTGMDTGLEVSIKEREEEERMEGTKGERIETESVNTIEGDEEVRRQETKHMSYSEAASRYKKKKRNGTLLTASCGDTTK